MTIQECYAALGGDYEDVVSRLRGERLVQKFLLKFLDDPSYNALCAAMAAKDREEAFRAAHTIKGVCQNLSFTALYQSSAALCDALRTEWAANAEALAETVRQDYRTAVDAIRTYQEGLPS